MMFTAGNGLCRTNLSEEHLSQELCLLFQALLGESPQEARNLAKNWIQYRLCAQDLWRELATASIGTSIQRADRVSMPDETLLADFLRCCRQGIVLLTIHMGDYLHSLFKILSLTSGRKVLILRRKSWSQADQSAFRKIDHLGHEMVTVQHGRRAAKTVVGGLRAGAIAVLLFDLSGRWGATMPVKLFNSNLRWVSGPLLLSMLGQSCVVPLFCFEQHGRCVCELSAVRDYRCADRNRLLHPAAELQQLASLAETYIRAYPAQWNHWHLIPEMMRQPSR